MKHENSKRVFATVAISLWLLCLGGCSSSPPQRFYTLGALGDKAMSAARANNMSYSVVVGPVTVPTLVDRPQMVLNAGPNRVTLQEQSRWAEPLKEGISRVMAADLSQALPDAYVAAYPQTAISNPDYRVVVDVQRFDSIQGEAVIIDMRWTVTDTQGDTQSTGRAFKREPVQGSNYEDLVAAHRRAIDSVSDEIASVVKEKVRSTQRSDTERTSKAH